MTEKAIIYGRQSDETRGEETISPEVQENAGRSWVRQKGYTLYTTPKAPNGFYWETKTGRTWHKRPLIHEALELIQLGHITVIVVWQWSRISRLRKHWIIAETTVERYGGRVESATEPADTSTSSGRFNRNIHIDLAEYQSDIIGDAWKNAHEARRSRGLPATGGERFGYHRIREKGKPERYIVDVTLSPIVSAMYEHYISGRGFQWIARNLNSHGIRTVRGRLWSAMAVAACLDSGFAAGRLARDTWGGEKCKYVPFPDRQWRQGNHEPIISEEVWQQYYQQRIARRTQPARKSQPAHEFSGLVYCGDCESPMNRAKQNGKPAFTCLRYRDKGDVQSVNTNHGNVTRSVLSWLGDVARGDNEAAERALATMTTRTDAEHDVSRLQSRLSTLDNEVSRLTRLYVAGDIEKGAYDQTLDTVTRERDQVRTELDSAHTRAAAPAIDVQQVSVDLVRDWYILPVSDRRAYLYQLIRRIVVTPTGPGRPAKVTVEPY